MRALFFTCLPCLHASSQISHNCSWHFQGILCHIPGYSAGVSAFCIRAFSKLLQSLRSQTSEMLISPLQTIHNQGTRLDGFIAPCYMHRMHLSWALILLPKMSCVIEFFLPIAVTQYFSLTETFPSSLAHLYFPRLTSISGKSQLHSNPCLQLYFFQDVVVYSLSPVRLFANPWTIAYLAPLSFTISWSLLRIMSTVSMMHPIISSSVIALSSCPQYFPASEAFPMSQFFASEGQRTGASASASVLPMNIQGSFPLRLTGLIFSQSMGLLRIFSSIIVQKHQFFGAQPSLWSNSHICT